jgi:hypothetical protein
LIEFECRNAENGGLVNAGAMPLPAARRPTQIKAEPQPLSTNEGATALISEEHGLPVSDNINAFRASKPSCVPPAYKFLLS